VKTIAGNGSGGFAGDGASATDASITTSYSIAIDQAGNVYIADGYSNRIRMVSAKTGVIDTVVGSGDAGWFNGAYGGDGGPATEANLNYPLGVAIDASNRLYVADTRNNRIRKVTGIAQDPAIMLNQLITDVTNVGPDRKLAKTVTLAETYYDAGDVPATCAQLVYFTDQVEKLVPRKQGQEPTGPKITREHADALKDQSTTIIDAIGCP
jgi:NHL repeat